MMMGMDKHYGFRGLVLFALLAAAVPAAAQQPGVQQSAAQEPAAEQASAAGAVELYRSAAQLQNTGVYDLAVDEWSTLLEEHPQDPLVRSARHNRGICLFQLGRFAEAARDFSAVAEARGPFDELETTLVNLGLAYFNQAQQNNQAQQKQDDGQSLFKRALEAFERQLREFPDGSHAPLARFYRAETFASLGQNREASEAYASFLERHPQHELKPRAVYGLGLAHADAGNHAQAEEALRSFKDFPQHELAAEVQLRLADALFAQGKYAEAGPHFASAAAADGFELADYALLRQAANAFEQTAYPEAARLYASLVEQYPRSSHVEVARLNAGKAWLRAGEPKRAIESFRELASGSGEPAAEAAHWLSRALLQSGQADEALRVAGEALSASPPREWAVELMLDRADAAYELEDHRDEALAGYAAVAEKFPDHPRTEWARFSAADAALALGDLAAARRHAERLLAEYPESEHASDARFVIAEVARLQGDEESAAAVLSTLLKEASGEADRELWRNRLALVYLTGQHDRAVVEALQPAVDRYADPALQGEAEYLLGTALLRLGGHDEAIRYLGRSLRTARGEATYTDAAQLNLARAQYGAGAAGEAMTTLQSLIRRSPRNPFVHEAIYRLGVFQAAVSDHAAALATFERLLNEWPQSRFVPYALYAAAQSYRAVRDPEAARRALDQLLEAHAEHEDAGPARLLRASVLHELGEPAAALADLDDYLAAESAGTQRADALYLQGLCRAELGQFEGATASFRRLVEEHPTYERMDRVLYELGWAHHDAGQEQEARETFARLAERFPQSELAAEALFRVGELDYQGERFADAARAYRSALAAEPTEEIREKALHKAGWSHFQAEAFEEAGKQFAAQLEAFPNGELALDARVMLAECYFQREDYPQALAEFEKVLPAVGASQSLQIIGLLHAGQSASQQQEWEKALTFLEQCQSRFPDSAYRHEVQYELGFARYHLKQYDRAYEDFAAVAAEAPGELGVRAQFMQGEVAMGKQEYADAVRIFYRVAFGHGYPDAPPEYHPWQAAAMFDAGRCLEQLGKQDAARKLYEDLAAQFPDAQQAEHARVRLQELGS